MAERGYLIQFTGMAGHTSPDGKQWRNNGKQVRDVPAKGAYLSGWDVNANAGYGDDQWTTNPALAYVFATQEEAKAAYLGQSTLIPLRPDGKPNRPLTAYSVVIEPDPLERLQPGDESDSGPALAARGGKGTKALSPFGGRLGGQPTRQPLPNVPDVRYTARDVPHLRDQTRHMWSTPIGQVFASIDLDRSFGDRSPTGKATKPHSPPPVHGWGPQTVEEYCAGQNTLLHEAELYWINRDMTTLLRHSADTIPAGTLDETHIPHGSGFVVFEEAIPGIDSANRKNDHLRIAAFGWGIVVVQGTRALHMEFYDRSARLFTPVERQLRVQDGLGELYFLGASAWELGTAADDWSGFYAPASELAKDSFAEDRRLIHSFFLLIQQKIASVNVRSPDRAERRRAERSGYTVMPDVRVVTLRERYAPSTSPPGTRQVEWSHRWITSGHWKQQWHPKKQIHVPTYIQPYPKGPADKPLVLRPTVNALRR